MILFRYLTRQLLATTLALTVALTAIIAIGRFINFLGDAATGNMAASILFPVLLYRMPGFVDIVLPLSLFIAILLVYGRMYSDSEMVVIHACGISPANVMAYTLGPALLVMVLLACFTLYITPGSFERAEKLLNSPNNIMGLNTLVPGRFQRNKTGDKANYTETMSPDHNQMARLFVASRQLDKDGNLVQTVTVANRGHIVQDEATGTRFLELIDGVRYEGWPGQRDFSVATFDTFGQQLEERDRSDRVTISSEASPTRTLWHSDKAWDRANLHWRLALPWMVPISILLAIPFSRSNPRQGRWFKLLPAVLLFLLYLIFLIAMRDSVAHLRLKGVWHLWAVHVLFLVLGGAVLAAESFVQRRARHAMRQEPLPS